MSYKLARIIKRKQNNKPSHGTSRLMVRDSHRLIAGTMSGLIALCLMGLFSVVDVSATSSSLSIALSGNPTINLSPTAEGKFADSGDETITVETTHAAGYTLSIKASGAYNPTSLDTNGGASSGGTVGFVTLGVLSDNEDVCPSGINAAAFDTTGCNGYWGYKPSKYNSVDNTTNNYYYASPTTSGDTLDETNNSDNNTYKVSIGARADVNTATASYSNTFLLAVTANPTPYTITYDANAGSDAVRNMPTSPENGSADGESVVISSAVPVRNGYIFRGWCSLLAADRADCAGTVYAAGATYALDQTQGIATNTLALYAVWEKSILYDYVVSMSKGVQAAAEIQEPITVPTSDDYREDVSNSGVYEYDAGVFGTASDAGNSRSIYYYRGVLEKAIGSYGSDGSATTYPNYVVLSAASDNTKIAVTDTCWRIVRTTGSGGVKMIYNGLWNDVDKTCANVRSSAQLAATSAYNGTSSTYQRIALVGYTYNPIYGDNNVTTPEAVGEVFGSNTDHSGNTADSTAKSKIDAWFATTINDYEPALELSAGYCNDRTAYSNATTSSPLDEIIPYATSGSMHFGAYGRNVNATDAGKTPSLNCPRGAVDLYTAFGATNGNKQLSRPVALLTADEASLAGSGRSNATQGSSSNLNSFLCSGSYFWLLSPYYRASGGLAYEFYLSSTGNVYSYYVSYTYGLRPVISLASGAAAVNGKGTATDPWIVNPPGNQ